MQAENITIAVPQSITSEIRKDVDTDEKQRLSSSREPIQNFEAQWLLENVIVPYFAEKRGLDPETADYDMAGELVDRADDVDRDEDGNFV